MTAPARPLIADLAGQNFDAVVVGAGVNGVSAALHLAAGGYSVLLVEKGDFGSGSSSRSSRLLHCGLRYLAPGGSMWDFALHPGRLVTALKMARKAMDCRAQFAHETPERVRHFTFYFPVMEGQPYDPWQIGLGLKVLAALGPGDPPLEQRRLSLQEARSAPLVGGVRDPERLRAVYSLREYQFEWPERIVADEVFEAERLGAVVRNYTAVAGWARDGEGWRLDLTDTLDEGATATVTAATVVNMGGIWMDRVNARSATGSAGRRITGTKGAHIVVQLPPECADVGLITLHRENEPFYCVPWRGLHYFGPTETMFDGDIDDVRSTEADIHWLLDEANHLLPGLGLGRDDVVYSWAGVRPLTYDPEQPRGARARLLHDLEGEGLPGVYAMTAGPIMTHRTAGEDVVAAVAGRLGPRGPAQPIDWSAQRFPEDTNAPPLMTDDPAIRLSDLVHVAETERVTSLVDILARRTGVGWSRGHGRQEARKAAEAVAGTLGWDDVRVDAEVAAYETYVDHFFAGPFQAD